MKLINIVLFFQENSVKILLGEPVANVGKDSGYLTTETGIIAGAAVGK